MAALDRPPRADREPRSADHALALLVARRRQRLGRHLQRRLAPAAARIAGRIPLLSKLFGFAQFDFAGPLALADGRYLAREPGESAGAEPIRGGESVLVVRTLAAPPPPARRRRRARRAQPVGEQAPLALARATAIRAFAPFPSEQDARVWLEEACEAEDTVDVLVGEGIALLNRALHAQAVASADPHVHELVPERAVAVRLGYGSGEQTAEGEFTEAREVDVWASGASRRRRRQEDLRPQERVAAVLGGREHLDVCEILLLRARADLDAGRERQAALQLRIGLEALLAELRDSPADPAHQEDMGALNERRHEAGDAANVALKRDLDPETAANVRELLETCERVLRRRRVLRG